MTIKALHLRTFDQKSSGLLSFKKIVPVYFETRFGVHTFFMKEAIDVVVLDKNSKVTAMKENLKPNRIFLWNMIHNRVLELPSGYCQKVSVHKGSLVTLLLQKIDASPNLK